MSVSDADSDERFMREALKEAAKALELGEVPIGAVVVANGRVIARGHNLTETLNDVTAHAEMQAITAAANSIGGKYLHHCTLYVTLEPCIMCAGALGWSQVSRVVYGGADPRMGYRTVERRILHPKTEVRDGIFADECVKLVKDFFAGKRRSQ